MEAIPEPRVEEPYRIAEDAWIIPEVIPAGPGTFAVVNSMVITGAEPVIVDTGNELSRDSWLDACFSVVAPHDVRWIFISHDDHDHVGNLLPALEACPEATLVTDWFTVQRLQRALPVPIGRLRWVNPGETFDVGDRALVAVVPPIFDSPTTRGLFDPRTDVYWAADAFACLLPGHVTETADIPHELWRESFLFSNRVGAPWHTLVDPAKYDRHVDSVAALGMTTVASAHATTLRGKHLDEAFRLIRQIARMDPAPVPGQAELDALRAVERMSAA